MLASQRSSSLRHVSSSPVPRLARALAATGMLAVVASLASAGAGCSANAGEGGDAFDAATLPGADLPTRPAGIPTCTTIPCSTPPPPYLPTCTAAINAAISALPPAVLSALGASLGGVYAYHSQRGYDTCYHPFANGSVEWSAASGAHELHGLIYQKWGSLGYEDAIVGMPRTDQGAAVGGVFNHFTGGSIYTNGAQAFEVRQPIVGEYQRDGWEYGIGLPTSDTGILTNPTVGAGAYNHFANNASIYTSANGTWTVKGPIRTYWSARAWEAGWLGYPLEEESVITTPCKQPGGCGAAAMQHFQHGVVVRAASLGTYAVPNELAAVWGGPSSCYGFPINEPTLGDNVTQAFEGGSIAWNRASGGAPVGSCCGAAGGACCGLTNYHCAGGLACNGGICGGACGHDGEACCAGGACYAGNACSSGVCHATTPPPPTCGGTGQACCSGGLCTGGLSCIGGSCTACGVSAGNLCCPGNDCLVSGLACAPNQFDPTGPYRCGLCGGANQPCCTRAGDSPCYSGLACGGDNQCH